MEPVSLSIGAVVAALVLKAAEKAGEKGVDSGWDAVRRIVGRLRNRFQERSDPDGEAALARVQDPPAGERQLAALASAIDRQVELDVTFAQELRGLVREVASGGVEVREVTQNAWGNQNIQIADVTDSTVNIDTGQPKH